MYLSRVIDIATLAIRDDGTYTPFSADAWGYAGQMTLLGMLMVFTVLAILWGVLAIFKLIFAPKKKKLKVPPEAVAAAVAESAQVEESSNEELVAIITAAVAAYMSEESGAEVSADGFRVVSFRRTGGGRSWNSK